jgi:hypothetical protein
MKTRIVSLGLALASSLVSVAQLAQPVMTSSADVFPVTENRLGSLSSVRKIKDTAAASATYASFATKIVFPHGTTSVTFSAASCAVESWCNNVYTIHNPVGVNMALSKFNPEGDVSLPSIFARTEANALILPVNSNLVGTRLLNVKTFLITEHKASTPQLPKLVNVGDYWKMYRSLAGTYTIGAGAPIRFSFPDQVATVIVVNETDAPVSGVTMDYPNNDPVITSIVTSGGTTTFALTGLTFDSYNKSWYLETSTNQVNWSLSTNATVGPNVTIRFPFVSGNPKCFWRIVGLQP